MDKYSQTYFVTNADMDKEYRLKPASAIMYLQDCFAQFLTTKNLAAFDLADKNIIWVVTEFQFEFSSNMPFWSEQIKVDVWMSEFTKLKMYADFTISHKGEIISKGTSCWMILNAQTKRPLSTNLISEKLNVVEDFMLGEHKKILWDDTGKILNETQYITNIGDIDFNDHVNNKSYIKIAESTTDKKLKETHYLKSIKIKFLKEAFLNDKLTCKAYNTKDLTSFLYKIEKEENPVCIICSTWAEKSKQSDIKEYPLMIRS